MRQTNEFKLTPNEDHTMDVQDFKFDEYRVRYVAFNGTYYFQLHDIGVALGYKSYNYPHPDGNAHDIIKLGQVVYVALGDVSSVFVKSRGDRRTAATRFITCVQAMFGGDEPPVKPVTAQPPAPVPTTYDRQDRLIQLQMEENDLEIVIKQAQQEALNASRALLKVRRQLDGMKADVIAIGNRGVV